MAIISCSGMPAALVILLLSMVMIAPAAQGLEIVNQLQSRCKLTVFTPPICQPCTCPMIYCIRAPCIQNCQCPQVQCQEGVPCEQPACVCTLECKFVPGVDVKPGATATLPVKSENFPLSFFTVEVKGRAYNAKAADLPSIITQIATVVVTGKPCAKGIQARVYRNPKFSQFQPLCLVRGERYGS